MLSRSFSEGNNNGSRQDRPPDLPLPSSAPPPSSPAREAAEGHPKGLPGDLGGAGRGAEEVRDPHRSYQPPTFLAAAEGGRGGVRVRPEGAHHDPLPRRGVLHHLGFDRPGEPSASPPPWRPWPVFQGMNPMRWMRVMKPIHPLTFLFSGVLGNSFFFALFCWLGTFRNPVSHVVVICDWEENHKLREKNRLSYRR